MIFNVNSGAGKQPVNTVPATASAFTFDGSAKEPLWQNFDPEQLTIGGVTSAIDAGTYTVYFTPKADYEWWDGTTTPKEVTWSIAKTAGFLSLSASSGAVTGVKGGNKTFTVTRAGDGAISASSGNTSVATVSVSGTTVTVMPKGYGTATITVSVAEGANHTAPGSMTYTITVDYCYLLNGSNQNTALTGGWIKDSNFTVWGEGVSKVATFDSNGMHFTSSTRIMRPANYISLANYTKLYVEVTSIQVQLVVSVMNRTNGDVGTQYSARVMPETTGTFSIDVSGLNGSYYICVASSQGCQATVRKVYLA